MKAVLEGQLPQERLQEAADRVRQAKARVFGPELAHPRSADPAVANQTVGSASHAAIAQRIADASITVVDGRLVPPSGRPLLMATRMARRFGTPVETQIRTALSEIGWDGVDLLMLDPIPDPSQIRKAVLQAQAAGWAALLHFNRVQSFDPEAVLTSDELRALADCVSALGVPTTIVSMGSPYALPRFERATARVCSYSTCDASLLATLRVLSGQAQPHGTLPVSLN
jgi:beta-N-acetylhexosaminidase